MVIFTLLGENLAQKHQNALWKSAMSAVSYVSTTDEVSFQTGENAILSNDGNAGLVGPDANTLLFGA